MQPRPQSAAWLFATSAESRAPRCWRTFQAPRCSSTQRMDFMQRGEDSIAIGPGLMTPSSGVFTASPDGADVSHVTAKETHYSPMSCCIVVAMSFLTFVEFGLVMPVSEVPVTGGTVARARLAGFAPFRCEHATFLRRPTPPPATPCPFPVQSMDSYLLHIEGKHRPLLYSVCMAAFSAGRLMGLPVFGALANRYELQCSRWAAASPLVFAPGDSACCIEYGVAPLPILLPTVRLAPVGSQ